MFELSAEQRLALVFGPRSLQASFATLLQFDAFLGKTIWSAREPILTQIRLGWWREKLLQLPSPAPGPDPLLAALDALVRTHRVDAADLCALVNAWETMLDESPLADDRLFVAAQARGGAVFRLASAIASRAGDEATINAGTLWALADFARHSADPGLAGRALGLATQFVGVARKLPREMRACAILARFAERDAVRGIDRLLPAGSPRRIPQAWGLALGLS